MEVISAVTDPIMVKLSGIDEGKRVHSSTRLEVERFMILES